MINNNRKNYIQNNYKKKNINNNDSMKNNNINNNKNTHNSMKDIYELKNKTPVIDSNDLKEPENLKKSEIIPKRDNSILLNQSNNEIKIKKKDISHSNIFKDLLINDDKRIKDNSLNKENTNSNLNINNKSKININHYAKKKVFLKYNSPKDDKKNIINNSSSIHNIMKEKTNNKKSRAYINAYNSNNNNLSLNKSNTFLSDRQQPLKEIKEIKEIFKSNILKNKEGIICYKNKSKNNYKKNFFSNNEITSINYNVKNINRNSDINITSLKNKNSSFDNLKEKENSIKTPNQNKNDIKKNIIFNNTINPGNVNKKMEHIESTKLIYQKNKYNKLNFFSPNSKDENKLKNKKNVKIKQYKYQTNNLSISSNVIKNKNKSISNSIVNINNKKNNNDDKIKGYISVRNNESNDNRKRYNDDKPQEQNNKNIIFSYKQKSKTNINK